MKDAHYNLVILGSDSTAFAAALRAQELGKTSVMTEERMTGGTCVNRSCLPSKHLIEAAKIIYDARHPRYPGLTPAEVKLNVRELIVQKDDVIHGYGKKEIRKPGRRPVQYRRGPRGILGRPHDYRGRHAPDRRENHYRQRLAPNRARHRRFTAGAVSHKRPAH